MILAIHLGPSPHWQASDGSAGVGLAVPDAARTGRIVAIAPGEAVALHFVVLPDLAPAQTLAAARLLAADVAGGSLEGTHVAIGARLADGTRPLALVAAAVMRGWLADLAAAGLAVDALVPEPLLLPLPEGDAIAAHLTPTRWVLRGAGLATAAEPDLARLLVGERPLIAADAPLPWRREPIDKRQDPLPPPCGEGDSRSPQGGGRGQAVALPLPIDLRQGEFARVRRWRAQAARLRRLGWLAAASLAVFVAGEAAATWRASVAADRAALELADAARAALPRGSVITAPRADVAARLAALGGGSGFAGATAALEAALETEPRAAIVELAWSPAAGLVATIAAPPATAATLTAAVQRPGLAVRTGPVRSGSDGAPLFDLMIAGSPAP